ncbi:MAG: Transcriptional regulator, LysR family [uncultured Propionibacteriaceae bacterium]|jgi:DNA-binding transcriptional LysR family regulator|uniref:Transcriptional regulator, LysR family n=1 Tax=uncultured Propionibacteriaceae bacterium TaxID=257457 RepID=A0A6J4P1H6_9ACTN|nr:MAG: Transcriptional regulator, LysR family [uncultured Propionibacteriaceae bacterium]
MADEKTFDPVQLRTFLAVATGLSFTRAAEQLGLSQPTVSQHVRRLEQSAGRQLITRDTRSVALTDNGEAMAGFARAILAANDEAVSYFKGSAMSGRLRFGAADELALSELPTILRDFRQLYPRINLELTVTQSGVLYRRLMANHLDLVFINQEADAGRGRLVRRDKLVWVGLERTQLEPGQPLPLITYHAPSWGRSIAINALEGVHRTWRITCNTREINGLLAATRAGIGICVLAKSRVPADLRVLSGRFNLPPLPDVEMALVANPLAAREPVEALSRAIVNVPLTPLRP